MFRYHPILEQIVHVSQLIPQERAEEDLGDVPVPPILELIVHVGQLILKSVLRISGMFRYLQDRSKLFMYQYRKSWSSLKICRRSSEAHLVHFFWRTCPQKQIEDMSVPQDTETRGVCGRSLWSASR